MEFTAEETSLREAKFRLAVAHTEFSNFTMAEMDKFFGEGKKVLLDLKSLLNCKEYEAAGYSYWRL